MKHRDTLRNKTQLNDRIKEYLVALEMVHASDDIIMSFNFELLKKKYNNLLLADLIPRILLVYAINR